MQVGPGGIRTPVRSVQHRRIVHAFQFVQARRPQEYSSPVRSNDPGGSSAEGLTGGQLFHQVTVFAGRYSTVRNLVHRGRLPEGSPLCPLGSPAIPGA